MRKWDIDIEKVGGKVNIADALTKECGSESLWMHIEGAIPKMGDTN